MFVGRDDEREAGASSEGLGVSGVLNPVFSHMVSKVCAAARRSTLYVPPVSEVRAQLASARSLNYFENL